MIKLRGCVSGFVILASCLAFGQDRGGGWRTYRPNEEVRVSDLPSLTAHSRDLPDVLAASLEIVFHDPEICCGKNSALQDRALTADPLSLKEVGSKIQGRQLLSDGRPIHVTANFVAFSPGTDISYQIINALKDNHALLMVWDSHLYVVCGAVFDAVYYSDSNSTAYMIHTLLLLDARFSGGRREVVFNRDSDDGGKVQGVLLLTWAPQ